MDRVLNGAIKRLLDAIEPDELVTDLLIIEVDWGQNAPPALGDVEEVEFQGARWPLVHTDSELVLRRTLCQSPNNRAVLVVPGGNGFVLPRDVQARAHQRRILRLGLQHRLGALTERQWPSEVDYPEWRPSIERHLDALVRERGDVGLANWTINRNDLERILVKAAFGLEVAGRSSPQLLADLVAHQRRQDTPPTDLERALLQGQLRSQRVEGQEILVWAAEDVGRAGLLVRTGIMLDAERAAQRMPNWGGLNSLRALLVNERQLSEQEAVALVIRLATSSLEHLHHETAKSIARAAEQELFTVLPDTAYNRWFPQVLDREIKRIGQRLAEGSTDTPDAIARLHTHLFASSKKDQLTALGLMSDLAAGWQEQAKVTETLVDVVQWSTWYGQAGSPLDLTALRLKQLQERGNDLGASIETLLTSYWGWRDRLNERFAKRLLPSYESALHDRNGGVFGVHRILDWVVRPLRQEGQRVLLVVVDGMGYAAFWCLAEQLRQAAQPVFVHRRLTVLSLLPSVTAMARKGLFLNALPTDRLDDDEVYEQKARTGEAAALQAAFPQDTVRLYNKGNIGDGEGLRSSLEFPGADVVAVIFNTIDDDLRSTTTSVRLPQLDDLGSFQSAAHSALKHGWAVVVTADHGHTWFRNKEHRIGSVKPGGGERYIPLAAGEDAPKGAVVTNDPHIVRVQDGQKVALLTPVGAYFGQQPRRGYHGGASLEEMIVPCAWLTDAPSPSPEQTGPATEPPSPAASPEPYDVQGVILRFADGRTVDLVLPFSLAPKEAQLLQALARMGEASEHELRQATSTRRVAGLIAGLVERLAAAGPAYDYIDQAGAGAEGAIYRFRTELLS